MSVAGLNARRLHVTGDLPRQIAGAVPIGANLSWHECGVVGASNEIGLGICAEAYQSTPYLPELLGRRRSIRRGSHAR